MFKRIKAKINNVRQNVNSAIRKFNIYRNSEESKIAHLKKTINIHYAWYGSSYGGFNIVPELLNQSSIVYSFGIGKDISFDLKLMKRHRCKVFGFDPTHNSINWIKQQKISELFYFQEIGISPQNELVEFYIPANSKYVSGSMFKDNVTVESKKITVSMKSFDQIASELGHHHLDLVKMDIEGSEYEVLEKMIESPVTIDQIVIEFHDRLYEGNEYKSKNIVEKLKTKGYEIFASSISYEEISFIHRRKLSSLNH